MTRPLTISTLALPLSWLDKLGQADGAAGARHVLDRDRLDAPPDCMASCMARAV